MFCVIQKVPFTSNSTNTTSRFVSSPSGLTQTKQEDLLKMFKDGRHKIIVATSVAEEGLDIQQCNTVIRYNYISNEIGRVQAQGIRAFKNHNEGMGRRGVVLFICLMFYTLKGGCNVFLII